MKKKSVLFVCLGNTCRSPIAESVFKDILGRRGILDEWTIDSAATAPWHVGKPPNVRAVRVLESEGLDTSHRARLLTEEDFATFYYILGMDNYNVEDIESVAPCEFEGKIRLLGHYDPIGKLIIRDPYCVYPWRFGRSVGEDFLLYTFRDGRFAMGIKNLLEFAQPACRSDHIKSFSGQTVAVDMYCWIHKGVSACAEDLILGRPTNAYVTYCVRRLTVLKNFGLVPIAVFDGRHLPSKAETEKKRGKDRAENRKRAADCYRTGNVAEARKFAMRAVDVTSAMAREVIEAVRKMKVRYVVAPYEADAQLAFLNLRGVADVVITEDSDLIVFGCTKIFFKCDAVGTGMLYEKEKLPACFKERATSFTFEKFRRMCILSGCDYLESLRGIGLKKAFKVFARSNVSADLWSQLKLVCQFVKISLTELKAYMEKFSEAENTFLYQLVYDPENRRLAPLVDYPEGKGKSDFPYAGDWLDPEKALHTACGNYDLKSDEIVADTDTDSWWRNVEHVAVTSVPKPATVPNICVSRRSLPAPLPKQNTLKDFFARKTKSVSRIVSNDDDDVLNFYLKREETTSGVETQDSGIEVDLEKTYEVEVKRESVTTNSNTHLEAFGALSKFTKNARLRKTFIDPNAPKVASPYFSQEGDEPSPKKPKLSSPDLKRRNPFAVCNADVTTVSPDFSRKQETPKVCDSPSTSSPSPSTFRRNPFAVSVGRPKTSFADAASPSGSPIVSFRKDLNPKPASSPVIPKISEPTSKEPVSPVVSKTSLTAKRTNKSPAKIAGRSLLEAFGFSRTVSRFKTAQN